MLSQITPPDEHISPEARRWLCAAGLSIKGSYRVDEVASLLDCRVRVIYKMIQRGDIDALRCNRTGQRTTPTRIPISSLLSLLD